MEYIIIIIISVITVILLKIGLNIHIKDIKKIKEIGYDKDLNKIGDKFEDNRKICEKILKKLGNATVKIEETNDTKSSLYIAISNKIIIANIKDTYTRIQTISHEALHSIQNRKILIFNFIFSNIFLLYFLVSIVLIMLNLGNSLIYIQIYIFLSIIYCSVRNYLENDAMSKAIYVAKEYMEDYAEENKEIKEEDINILVSNFDKLNKIGIPFTNFYLITGTIVKIVILSILALI